MKQIPLTIVKVIKKEPDKPINPKIDRAFFDSLKGSYVCQLDYLTASLGSIQARYDVSQNEETQDFSSKVTWKSFTAIANGGTMRKSKQYAACAILKQICREFSE